MFPKNVSLHLWRYSYVLYSILWIKVPLVLSFDQYLLGLYVSVCLLKLPICLFLKRAFCEKHLVPFFNHPDTLCLLVERFRPFILNVIIKINKNKSTNFILFSISIIWFCCLVFLVFFFPLVNFLWFIIQSTLKLYYPTIKIYCSPTFYKCMLSFPHFHPFCYFCATFSFCIC